MITFIGDEKAIYQLTSILLDNALKYSLPEGSVCLMVRRQGKLILLSVWNTTNEELSKKDIEMIFERFYRINTSVNTEIQGHGIGLSVAKAIAESHGGKIQAIPGNEPSLKVIVTLPG